MARKKNGSDPITTTANRPRMGNEAYTLGGGNRSASDVRPGMLVPKNNSKGGSEPGTAAHRQGVPQATLGASFRIRATRTPYSITDQMAPTQANGRIVPAVTGSKRNFRANW